MLNENMKAIRKSKGLSQQELAVKLNVVRQTVSKWEQVSGFPHHQKQSAGSPAYCSLCGSSHRQYIHPASAS